MSKKFWYVDPETHKMVEKEVEDMKEVTDENARKEFEEKAQESTERKPFAKIERDKIYEATIVAVEQAQYLSDGPYHSEGDDYWQVETEDEVIRGKTTFFKTLYAQCKKLKLPAKIRLQNVGAVSKKGVEYRVAKIQVLEEGLA